ncbi:MAG TPA: flagellar protein FlgN [Beijerinckiaceae bacterium]
MNSSAYVGHAAASELAAVIDRLEATLDAESRELATHDLGSLSIFNERKARGLVELNRAIRALGPVGDDALRRRVEGLRIKLEDNRRRLAAHLQAARDISALLTRAIQDAESDGTYSRRRGAAAL